MGLWVDGPEGLSLLSQFDKTKALLHAVPPRDYPIPQRRWFLQAGGGVKWDLGNLSVENHSGELILQRLRFSICKMR